MHAMSLWTAIGATFFSSGAKTFACASALTVTTSKTALRTGAKMPAGVSACATTSIVLGDSGNVTVGVGMPA